MKFLAPGFQEIARKGRRLQLRAKLFFTDKKLRRAELQLGWLGWQQAHFFGTEMQAEIEKIQQFEKEQADLLNLSAEISGKHDELKARREAARHEFDAALTAMRKEREPHEHHLAECEGRLAERREALRRFESALKDLHQLRSALANQPSGFEPGEPEDADVHRVAGLVSAERARVEGECEQLERDRLRAMNEVAELTDERAAARSEVARCLAEERHARREFSHADRALAGQIQDCTRRTKLSSKRMNALDANKSKPFRLIGSCLADHAIAPMNQPEALTEVLALREKAARGRTAIELSRSQSAGIPKNDLLKFYALFAMLLLLGAWVIAQVLLHDAHIPQ
ncbi:MAG: hypothetical protein QOD99_3185 [Chthoniobacter sp.]|nr:hypothetical protein [Chthoniobacter sp.]